MKTYVVTPHENYTKWLFYCVLYRCTVCIKAMGYTLDGHHTNGAGPHGTVSRVSDSRARGPWFDTQSGHILSFLHLLIQEGQLSVTGESMCL